MRDINLLVSNGIDVKKSLELFGDMTMYDATLQDFLDGVDEKKDLLKKYKEEGHTANYAIYAHSLKSDARYLGFTHLAELAYEHELKGKDNDMYYIVEHYDELLKETDRIISLVKSYLGNEGVNLSNKTNSSAQTKKKILVVDDSDIIRNFVKKIFSETYEVVSATDGKEALKIINEAKDDIACMLLDLNMPNVNGFEVLDYLKNNDLLKKIPVSIITGEESDDSISKAKTYDIVDVLFKPFNPKNIKIIVERTINKGA